MTKGNDGVRSFLRELFEYNHICNQKLAGVIVDSDNITAPITELLNHVLNAHRIWNHRIAEKVTNTGVWQINDTLHLRQLDSENTRFTLDLLRSDDLGRTVSYKNTKDQQFNNSVRDILFHVINHSTYHRGQIASQLKQAGIEVPVTDYIVHKR